MLEERNEHIKEYINKSTTKANTTYKGLISDETIEKGIALFTSSDYESRSEEEIFKEIDKIIKEMIEDRKLKMQKLKGPKQEENNNRVQINTEPRLAPLDDNKVVEPEKRQEPTQSTITKSFQNGTHTEQLIERKEEELTTMIESPELQNEATPEKTQESKSQEKTNPKVLTRTPSVGTGSNDSGGFINILYVIGMMGLSFVSVAAIVSLLLKIVI